MISGEKNGLPCASDGIAEAETRAWNSFYHSGKIEDYIRYAQLKHREDANCAAGVPDAGKNARVDH